MRRNNTFDEMLIKMLPTLRQYALSLTRNAVESEDLVNTVILRCLEKHYQFITGTNFKHWSARIMYTTYISSIRKSKRRLTYQLNDYMANNDDPSSTQLILELKAGLQKLPLSSRRIVINIANGETYSNVAQMEHVSIETVRCRLSRGRAALREYCDRQSV